MKIVWSELAKIQLKEIYQYHKEVASLKVAKSIKIKIFKKTKKLLSHPEIGQREESKLIAPLHYRYLVSGSYKIVYKIFMEDKIVLIAAVFDTRQNPDDLSVGF
jgi:plasmid stabilization system protein ParE